MEIVANASQPKEAQRGPIRGRMDFWKFCERAASRMRVRSSMWGMECDVTAHDLDAMLVDTGWRCAVSGIPFDPPGKGPFAPSVDRIDASRGYQSGNVRVVCNIVNYAMNEWGEAALWKLIDLAENHR